MSEKLVHVKAYTKDDGTKVKEHYRGGVQSSFVEGAEPSLNTGGIIDGTCIFGGWDDIFNQRGDSVLEKLKKFLSGEPVVYTTALDDGGTIVLDGGVSMDVYPVGSEILGQASEAVQAIIAMAQMVSGIAIEGIKVASAAIYAIKNLDEVGAAQLGIQMEEIVGNMRQAQILSVSTEQSTLEKLSNTTNQHEYKELYDTYVKQRELNSASEAVINRISYSAEHKNYEDVVSGLKEYNSLHTQSAQSVIERANLNAQPNTLQFEEQPLPKITRSVNWTDFPRTFLHDYPELEKGLVSGGMFYEANVKGAYDAKELWKAAAYDFEQSGEYIEQNGYLLDTIDRLSEPFHSIVRKKVREQIGMSDCKGVILMPDSALSQEIAMSPEFKEFLYEKQSELLGGKMVSGSKCFSSSENLALAIGNADIINTYIAANGDIVSYVLDTYDFNKNDPRWYVEWAYNVQENKLMTNFYTLNIIIIPRGKMGI